MIFMFSMINFQEVCFDSEINHFLEWIEKLRNVSETPFYHFQVFIIILNQKLSFSLKINLILRIFNVKLHIRNKSILYSTIVYHIFIQVYYIMLNI